MNAIDFLLKEHNKVRTMLADMIEGSHRDETKKKMFDELCYDLLRHEKMEETVWYPQLKKDEKLFETIKHLIKEEKGAEKAIKELQHLAVGQEWEKKFKKFKDDVEHHASEEETELFPKVKKHFSEQELERIGKEMLAFKNEYQHVQQ